MFWAGISLGGPTDLHVFQGGTLTGVIYRDYILDPYVRPCANAIDNDFILMDDNAHILQALAALNPHKGSIEELEQSLLRVCSSLPISVTDNLIDSMEIRCRQCIQVRVIMMSDQRSRRVKRSPDEDTTSICLNYPECGYD
ncbi:uncharacterized protein TNCV_1030971 [Trichonephila clavipes]|nr:uncharacterized protein TNCV_1030971 [Trichonephila clavipes]